MVYIANVLKFKYISFIIVIVFSVLTLSACNDNQNKGEQRHTDKQEISPLGEGQSVNDAYPNKIPPPVADTNNTTNNPINNTTDNSTNNTTTNSTNNTPPSNIKQVNQDELITNDNIIINLSGALNATSVCQALILQVNNTVDTQATPYMPAHSQELNDSSEDAYSRLLVNHTFVNSTVVYTNLNETLYKDNVSSKYFMSINKTNISNLSDIANNSYYPLVICGENDYSYFSATSKLNFVHNATTNQIDVPVKPFAELQMVTPHRSAIERTEPQPDVNKILIDAVFATDASHACKVAVLQTPKNYPANNYITNLYTTVYSQISKHMQTGSTFLGGTIVYSNVNEKVYVDGSTLQKYFELDKQNFTNFDMSTNDYYPIITCGDELYSDFSSSSVMVANQTTGIVNNVDVVLSDPPRPTHLQADEPNISSNMFIMNISFGSSNAIRNSACQLIIVSINPSIPEPRNELASGVFMKSMQDLRSLQAGARLTNNTTVVYTNTNETLYESAATGQIYMSVTPTVALDLQTNDYYPIVSCDTVYSDIANETKFVSSDGLNIDSFNISMVRPQVVAYTASEDPAFGASAPNSTSAMDAFNANRSFTFVLNLTKIPDPANANCLYAASIVYGANVSNATLPMNRSDFESLVPGGSFGNSESDGVLLVVRNPVMHRAASGDYYLGVTSRIAKNVTNYTNVALCELSSGATMAGYNVNNSLTASTFNTDTAQGVFFSAIQLQSNTPILQQSRVFNNSVDPKFYAQIKFEGNSPNRNCLTSDKLIMFFPMSDSAWNTLKSVYSTWDYQQFNREFGSATSGAQGTSNGQDYVVYSLQFSTDYVNWYTNNAGIAPTLMARPVNAPSSNGHGFVTTGTNDKAYILGFCRDGSVGYEYVSNLTKVQPMQVTEHNGIYEITPRPYVIYFKHTEHSP